MELGSCTTSPTRKLTISTMTLLRNWACSHVSNNSLLVARDIAALTAVFKG